MSTYVMSDVHGLKDRYDAMLEALALKEEDTLYILGDVIDRGPDGIAILRDVMTREHVVMLLGNHEYMMKQYYEAVHHVITDMQTAWEVIDRWKRNHCNTTINAFERLKETEQRELLDYLDQLPLAVCDLRVKDELFYLAHGSALPQFTQGIVTQQSIRDSDATIEQFVWDRMDVHEIPFSDRTVVVGHTPTLFFQDTRPYAVWTDTDDLKTAHIMDIDCGCAADDMHTRLGVVCLDTRTVQYF